MQLEAKRTPCGNRLASRLKRTGGTVKAVDLDFIRHLVSDDNELLARQQLEVAREITRIRLAEVQRLLRSTREPIDAIAAQCGYENPNYLKNLFRKKFNMSMRDFRKIAERPRA